MIDRFFSKINVFQKIINYSSYYYAIAAKSKRKSKKCLKCVVLSFRC